MDNLSFNAVGINLPSILVRVDGKSAKTYTNDTFLFAGEGSYFFENPKMLKIQGRSRDLAFKYEGVRPI